MDLAVFQAAAKRHSVYALGKDCPVDTAGILELAKRAVSLAPSAFNSQGARVVVMAGKEHDVFWEQVLMALRPLSPDAASYEKTKAKIGGFGAAAGTFLFFEDQKTIRDLQSRFPLYKDVFPVWSLESAGMLQFLVWTALAEAGVGASLQHYNPLIDSWLAGRKGISPDWKLVAQMPYGRTLAPAEPKDSLPISERVLLME
jgi:predicted oxidoreductase (fatty acid repression mutant protein)